MLLKCFRKLVIVIVFSTFLHAVAAGAQGFARRLAHVSALARTMPKFGVKPAALPQFGWKTQHMMVRPYSTGLAQAADVSQSVTSEPYWERMKKQSKKMDEDRRDVEQQLEEALYLRSKWQKQYDEAIEQEAWLQSYTSPEAKEMMKRAVSNKKISLENMKALDKLVKRLEDIQKALPVSPLEQQRKRILDLRAKWQQEYDRQAELEALLKSYSLPKTEQMRERAIRNKESALESINSLESIHEYLSN